MRQCRMAGLSRPSDMSLTPVLFLFLCHLGIGIVFTLLQISSAAGVRFFRFTSALAFILMVLGIAFHPSAITFSEDAQGVSAQSTVPLALTIASFLTSAALLGSSFTAMLLGHWYLVLPSMDVSFLQSIVRFHLGSTLARGLVVGAVAWAAAATWDPLLAPSFGSYVFSIDGIFFWQRVLFGLIGPAVLAYMTWETAKIRSTQSR